MRHAPRASRFPYTTLFRSDGGCLVEAGAAAPGGRARRNPLAERNAQPYRVPNDREGQRAGHGARRGHSGGEEVRSEEHTSELQSRVELVCRLLLEKKN